MPFSFKYTPPEVDARLRLALAKPIAEQAAAEIILAASQPLVPVEHGDLKASGRIERDAEGAHILYDAVAPDGYAYGIRQHEDLALNHPNGGQAKFLEQPMHTEVPHAAEAIAETVRRALS